MKAFFKYFLFCLIPLLVFIFIAEILTRYLAVNYVSNRYFIEKEKGLIEVRLPLAARRQTFLAPKPRDVYRVFCVGGSSTYGLGFHEKSAFPQRLQAVLSANENRSKVEVINLGVLAYTSDGVLRILKQALRYEPDLVIAYMGHNEFVWIEPFNQVEHPRLHRALSFLLENSAAFNGMVILVHKALASRLEIPAEQWMYQEDDVNAAFSEAQRSVVERNFELNIKKISSLYKNSGAKLVFTTVISNEYEFYPVKSLFNEIREDAARNAYRKGLLDAAKLMENGRHSTALLKLDKLVNQEPDYAMARFLRGRALMAVQRYDEAIEDFKAARDMDDYPIRAPSFINDKIRSICKENEVLLLDLEQRMRAHAKHGLIGFDLCYDYLHHNIACQHIIAVELANFMQNRNLLPEGFKLKHPAPDIESVNRELDVRDEYLAQRYIYIALLLGFDDARPVYLDYSREMLETAERLWPDNQLTSFALGVLSLRAGDPESCRAAWEHLLQENPDLFYQAAVLLPRGWIHLAEDLILFKQDDFYVAPHFASYGTIKTGLLKPGSVIKRENPEDPLFLEKFLYAFKWNTDTESLENISVHLAVLLDERNILLAETGKDVSAPIPLTNYKTLNCRQIEKAGFLEALNEDPQIIFKNIEINPLVADYIGIEMEYSLEKSKQPHEVNAAVYWATEKEPEFSEKRKLDFKIIPDGKIREYSVPVANRWTWISSGMVNGIRIDPGDTPKARFKIHGLKIMPINTK